ncbi:MAG: patatin-like phospholipase family protein [Thermoanaerobaculia bacterium]
MTESLQEPTSASNGEVGLVLTGGGARAAYQVGFLRCLVRRMPEASIPIVTGVSAGAINAAFLAAHRGTFSESVADLSALWSQLEVQDVFRADPWTLFGNVLRWGRRLLSGGAGAQDGARSLVDPAPLRRLLHEKLAADEGGIPGIARNLARGRLRAVALTALDYSTGQTVTWVQGCQMSMWERPHRRSECTSLTVDHVMASAALPMVFPAVSVGHHWFGDGGIRHSFPLSPALHLGADRIVAISARYPRSIEEAERPVVLGYPPPAQILGQLLNAVFLDALDQDALRTERFNALLESLPPERRQGMRPVEVMVLRPSQDLGRMAAEYEVDLPKAFRFLTRGLGTTRTESPDLLSLLLFHPDYLQRMMDLGEADAEARIDELTALFAPDRPQIPAESSSASYAER